MHGRDTLAAQANRGIDRQPWSVLVLLSIAQFMVILDITVVNVALPSIGTDLHFTAGDLQWVISAYVLFTGGLLLLGGRAADILGRRPIFFAGLLIFTAASLASGLAASPAALIVARAVQGIGAAMLSPAALSIITTTYAGSQRTTALSAWGAIAAGGGVVGMVVGGMLTTWLSWEWIFFINVPVGLVVALLALRLVPTAPGAGGLDRLDVLGAIALVGGLVTLVYGIERTRTEGWGSAQTLILFGAAAALLATFVRIERGASQPLLPLSTWRSRTLSPSVALMLGATGFLVGVIFLGSLYMQGTLGYSALETGLAFLPLMVVIGVGAHLAPHLLGRFGARSVAAGGLLLMALAAGLLAAAPDRASYAPDLLPGLLITGTGVGLLFVTIQVTAMSEVREESSGLAAGLITTAHEIGAAFGVAVLTAVAIGTGEGAALSAGSAGGYEDGLIVSAAAALALAVLAVMAVPGVRPTGDVAHAGLH
jgi:EmrB/QacA subfamily drug resistance transporter